MSDKGHVSESYPSWGEPWTLTMDCPSCGGSLHPVTETKPYSAYELRAALECVSCSSEWLILVQLTAVGTTKERVQA